jgi:2'-5' RNA ligase
MKLQNRLYYAFLTEDWQVGHRAKRSPQHLTLIPPFMANVSLAKSLAKDIASNFASFKVMIGKKTYFGPKKDIEVFLIEPSSTLNSLHKMLLEKLHEKKVDINHLKHTSKDFRPHITVKLTHPRLPQTGQPLTIDHIALMKKTRHERILVAKEKLSDG